MDVWKRTCGESAIGDRIFFHPMPDGFARVAERVDALDLGNNDLSFLYYFIDYFDVI